MRMESCGSSGETWEKSEVRVSLDCATPGDRIPGLGESPETRATTTVGFALIEAMV